MQLLLTTFYFFEKSLFFLFVFFVLFCFFNGWHNRILKLLSSTIFHLNFRGAEVHPSEHFFLYLIIAHLFHFKLIFILWYHWTTSQWINTTIDTRHKSLLLPDGFIFISRSTTGYTCKSKFKGSMFSVHSI